MGSELLQRNFWFRLMPRYFEAVDEFDKTASGKIKRADLRARGLGAPWDRRDRPEC